MNVQDECIKIHSKFGMSEMANYKIQLLFDSEIEKVKKEYEEKLRWIPIYEPPKTAELVIVDSGENLHACVAVAFFENGIWKYANGQTLWFTPRRWRRFYNAT